MKKFIKKNKVYIFVSIICLLIMLFFALNETNVFHIIKEYIFNPDYRDNYSLAESNVKINMSLMQVIKSVLTNYKWEYDYMLIWGTNVFQTLLPFLIAISGINFYKKYQTIWKSSLYRNNNHAKFLFKEIFKESLKLSLSILCSYFIFYILCIFISKGMTNPSITRTLFIDIIGEKFYYNYTYLYYLLDGVTKFFITPMIYSFFVCSISLKFKNLKQVCLIPVILYFGLSLFSTILYYIIGDYAIYFSPATIIVSGAYDTVNTLLIFMFDFILIFISIVFIRRNVKSVEI